MNTLKNVDGYGYEYGLHVQGLHMNIFSQIITVLVNRVGGSVIIENDELKDAVGCVIFVNSEGLLEIKST